MKSRRRSIRFYTMALLVLLIANAAEETFSVDLHADRQHVRVAEPVRITLAATAPKGWKIELPEIPAAFGELKVIETVDDLQESDAGMLTATTRFQLESLLPGHYQVGPLDVRFVPDSGLGDDDSASATECVQRSTQSITIRVSSALGLFEGRRLRNIYGTVSTPWTWQQWTVTATAIIAVAVIGGIVYRGVDRWLRSRGITQRRLLEQLDRLDEARLDRSISNDQMIISVADVVRQSLQLAEGTGPVYRTTDEWIEHLESFQKSGQPSDAVKLVLREADAIKFARKAATLDQARRSLNAARMIVRSLESSHARHGGR